MSKKLNIGCNKVYKSGYTNINPTQNDTEDLVSPAYDLPFKDNSISFIQSYNIIEQLEYPKSITAFEEWYRILEEDGELVIESNDSDIIITNFMKSGNVQIQQNLLKLLFQPESKEYYHSSGYFFEKLSILLTSIGFDYIERENPKVKPYNESFRLKCKKRKSSPSEACINKIKLNIIKTLELCNNDNYYLFWEVYDKLGLNLIPEIVNSISKIDPKSDHRFLELITISPIITKILIEECIAYKLVSEDAFKQILNILEILIAKDFTYQCYLNYFFQEKTLRPLKQHYLESITIISSFLETLLNLKDNEEIETQINDFQNQRKDIKFNYLQDHHHLLYLESALIQISNNLEIHAIKEFSKGNIKESYNKFITAIQFNPEATISYANAGIIEAFEGQFESALELFIKASRWNESNVIKLNMAMCYLYLKKYTQAIKTLEKIDIESFEKYNCAGNCYFLLENYEEALEAFQWSVIKQPSIISYINLYTTQKMLGNEEEAQRCIDKALQIQSDVKYTNSPYMPIFKPTPINIDEL